MGRSVRNSRHTPEKKSSSLYIMTTNRYITNKNE